MKKIGRGAPLQPASATSRSRPPDATTASRPHVLVSPVLSEPVLLSREKRYLVGRGEEADIRVKITRVSRRHAEVFWDGRCFVVLELGSTNGSTLNDRRLVEGKPIPLINDDRLGFGGYEVKVQVLTPGTFPESESDLSGTTRMMKDQT